MTQRTRHRVQATITAILAVILIPVALPTLGAVIGYQAWANALGWRLQQSRSWPGWRGQFLRVWWWYGYHGLYQIDWAMKRRARRA